MNNTAEKLNKQPDSEIEKPTRDKAAIQDVVTGTYMAVFKMGDMDRIVPVVPLNDKNISEITGTIAMKTEDKEEAVSGELALNKAGSDDELIEKGKIARQAIAESVDSLEGQTELLNNLRDKVFNGLSRNEAEIFVLEGKNAEFILNVKQSETKGSQLNRDPGQRDVTNKGNQFALVMTPDVGEELKSIFVDNGHRIYEMPSGKGFQAEMGNIRIAFLYPDKVVKQDGELEETDKDEEVDESEEEKK